MILSKEQEILKGGLSEGFQEVVKKVFRSALEGVAIHLVEEDLWRSLQALGLQLIQAYVQCQGTGDLGPTLEEGGKRLRRLEKVHERRYVSIFGPLKISRTIYGSREAQKHEVVPLDGRLGLPEDEFSLLFQNWAQQFCVNMSFSKAKDLLKEVLGIGTSVRTLEHMNRANAKDIRGFLEAQPEARKIEGGKIHVLTADGKGVPMRLPGGAKKEGKRRKKGEKATKKREACVGGSYIVDRFVRSPEDVVDEILRKKKEESRPRPEDKRLQAELSRTEGGREINGKDEIFAWLKKMKEERDPEGKSPLVIVMDGARYFWKKAKEIFPEAVMVLDLYHVMERLWVIAHVFFPEGSEEAEGYVEKILLGILRGRTGRVVGGIQQKATKLGISGEKKKRLMKALRYLKNNKEYMRYDQYLAEGYPIGSGVVEGACRHLVKDRMELSGMTWTVEGAQAMLWLRARAINEEWKDFHAYRAEKVMANLYPWRDRILEKWPIAA